MSEGHFKVECKECKKIITQCRCMDLNKKVLFDTCSECEAKKREEKK